MTQKIALVTGASRGLGFGLAEALAADDYHVIAVARTTGALEELDDVIKAAGGTATLAPLDVNNDGAMQHLCVNIHERWGGVNLWAHTAIHAAPLTPASHVDAKDLEKSVATNVTAASRLIGYVTPLLQANTGRAVFFDDPAVGTQFHGAYGATKGAAEALVKSWQAETVNTGPKVDMLTPNPMPTALRARFYPGEDRAPLADPRVEAKRLLSLLA